MKKYAITFEGWVVVSAEEKYEAEEKVTNMILEKIKPEVEKLDFQVLKFETEEIEEGDLFLNVNTGYCLQL